MFRPLVLKMYNTMKSLSSLSSSPVWEVRKNLMVTVSRDHGETSKRTFMAEWPDWSLSSLITCPTQPQWWSIIVAASICRSAYEKEEQGVGESWAEQTREKFLMKIWSRAIRHQSRPMVNEHSGLKSTMGLSSCGLWVSWGPDLNPINQHLEILQNGCSQIIPIQPDKSLRGFALKNGRKSPNLNLQSWSCHTQGAISL